MPTKEELKLIDHSCADCQPRLLSVQGAVERQRIRRNVTQAIGKNEQTGKVSKSDTTNQQAFFEGARVIADRKTMSIPSVSEDASDNLVPQLRVLQTCAQPPPRHYPPTSLPPPYTVSSYSEFGPTYFDARGGFYYRPSPQDHVSHSVNGVPAGHHFFSIGETVQATCTRCHMFHLLCEALLCHHRNT